MIRYLNGLCRLRHPVSGIAPVIRILPVVISLRLYLLQIQQRAKRHFVFPVGKAGQIENAVFIVIGFLHRLPARTLYPDSEGHPTDQRLLLFPPDLHLQITLNGRKRKFHFNRALLFRKLRILLRLLSGPFLFFRLSPVFLHPNGGKLLNRNCVQRLFPGKPVSDTGKKRALLLQPSAPRIGDSSANYRKNNCCRKPPDNSIQNGMPGWSSRLRFFCSSGCRYSLRFLCFLLQLFTVFFNFTIFFNFTGFFDFSGFFGFSGFPLVLVIHGIPSGRLLIELVIPFPRTQPWKLRRLIQPLCILFPVICSSGHACVSCLISFRIIGKSIPYARGFLQQGGLK